MGDVVVVGQLEIFADAVPIFVRAEAELILKLVEMS
jgi:hypothetical protein